MSIVICENCERQVDSDIDDCFVEVGNMRRLHKEIVLCEPCRDRYFEELERDDLQRMEAEATSQFGVGA